MPRSSSNFATAVPGLTVIKGNLVYPQAMNAKPMSLRRRDTQPSSEAESS
jgi:hypothetical protein